MITLRQIDDYCELSIKDTGIGIDTEHLENLGERFTELIKREVVNMVEQV